MIIGLVPGSFKPYHIGHHNLVLTASKECDEVHLYVSLSDRTRKNELTVRGDDMKLIWKEFIEPILPPNVVIFYGGSPVGNVWKELENANKNSLNHTYVLYGDKEDITTFSSESLNKYANNLYAAGKIKFRPVERLGSGTKMRQLVQAGNKAEFIKNMPAEIDASAVFDILSKRVQSEQLIRQFVKVLIHKR